jgi:hypothetical protein
MSTENKTKRIMLAKNLKAVEHANVKEDSILQGTLHLDVLDLDEVKKLVYTFGGRRYLNVKIMKRKEATDFATHYLEVDQFIPESKPGDQ